MEITDVSHSNDVLVVGAGAVGLACAYYLQKAGRHCLVVDAGEVGAGSSHGNCGTITPSHMPLTAPGTIAKGIRWLLKGDAPLRIAPTLSWSRLAWLARFAGHCHPAHVAYLLRTKTGLLIESGKELARLIGEADIQCEFEAGGTLAVYRDRKVFDEEERASLTLKAAGIDVETIGDIELRRREPALKDTVVGAHYFPGDAQLRPERYVAGLARAVAELGGEIRGHEAVVGFETRGDRIEAVRTEKSGYRPREVVLAMGAWSPQLAGRLGLRLPIQPGKGYSVTFSRPALAPTLPMLLKERAMFVSIWQDGMRLGGTMEFAGYDPVLNRKRLEALRRSAAEYLLEPEGPQLVEEWYGWRPMTYDDLPILGRSHAWRNLALATGHGMLGITMSALTGKLIAETITGQAPSRDLQPYSPDRFG